MKMNTKKFIIELSKEYSIVTQFTSFVAIEKLDKDDVVAADAPTMAELVEWEDVDQLTYMGFEKVSKCLSVFIVLSGLAGAKHRYDFSTYKLAGAFSALSFD